MTSTALGLCACEIGRAQAAIGVRVAVDDHIAGTQIPTDFIGLSYESAIVAGGDYFTPSNTSLLGLIRLLGPNGVIRVGGNERCEFEIGTG